MKRTIQRYQKIAKALPSDAIRQIMNDLGRGADDLDRMIRRALQDELNRRSLIQMRELAPR